MVAQKVTADEGLAKQFGKGITRVDGSAEHDVPAIHTVVFDVGENGYAYGLWMGPCFPKFF